MNKIVKALLLILVVLLIAGGGFWSGTRFAYQQTAALPVQASSSDTPPTTITPASPNPSANTTRPGWNQQGDGNNMIPQGRFGGNNSNAAPDQGKSDARQDNRFTPGSRSMAANNNQNFGPQAMLRENQQQSGAGFMMDRRTFGGYRDNSIGGLFMGGGMMIFGLLFPLGFAILMVLGIIVLYRMVRKPSVNPVVGMSVCAKCGGSIQNDWKHCPHCGELI